MRRGQKEKSPKFAPKLSETGELVAAAKSAGLSTLLALERYAKFPVLNQSIGRDFN